MKEFAGKLLDSKYTIIIVLILALLLRLVTVNQSLWLDEAIGAYAVKNFTYKGIFEHFLKFDNHPPLYYFLLKFWTGIFGYSELSIRFPSIIFGVGTVYLTYLIAKELFGEKNKVVPVISSLFITTSQFHIYYSQEARMYSMAVFFASLVIFVYFKIAVNKGSARVQPLHWVVYSLSVVALVFTDYVPVFLIPIFWIYALYLKKNKKWWIKFIASHIPVVVFGLLWLPTFLVQAGKGKWLLSTLPEWRDLAGGATFKQAALVWMKFTLGRISFRDKLFYYSLVVISSIPFAISFIKVAKLFKKYLLIWMWFLLPLTFGFLASFLAPIFIYFRFLYVVPAFYLLVALGASRLKSNKFQHILIASILLVNLVGCTVYFVDSNQQREKWREATKFVDNKITNREVAIFEYPQPFTPYRWYTQGKVQAVGVCDSISCDFDKTSQKTKRVVENKNGVYYFEYLSDLTDPGEAVEKTLKDEGFEVVEVYDYFPGVGQVFYYRKFY